MEFYAPRTDTVTNIVTYLRTAVPTLSLVKPYEGEFYMIWKRAQLREDIFVAEVNLAAPFALVSSKSRSVSKGENRKLTLKHELSVLVGVANPHNLGSLEVPSILALLELCADALVGTKFHANASELNLENDGIFLTKTDLYIIYEQQYFQTERATT